MSEQTTVTMIDSPTFGRVLFDAVFRVEHTMNVTMTKHPVQTGASISDHAYLEPDEVTLEIGMSDSTIGSQDNHSVNTYTLLRKIAEAREPVTLVTRLHSYPNMLITSLSVPDDYTTMHGMKASVYFAAVNIVDVAVTRVQEVASGSKSSGGGGSSKKSSGSSKNSSSKKTTETPKQPDKSVLKRLHDKFS